MGKAGHSSKRYEGMILVLMKLFCEWLSIVYDIMIIYYAVDRSRRALICMRSLVARTARAGPPCILPLFYS